MRLKTILWALYLTCSLAGSLACNTVHGMGQDIERGGEKTQDAADAGKTTNVGTADSLKPRSLWLTIQQQGGLKWNE